MKKSLIGVYKLEEPALFRSELRVSPWTFDMLLAAISTDPIFMNNSPNSQFPVERQLAIALYRFGHYGNAAGLQKVANWAGVGKGYAAGDGPGRMPRELFSTASSAASRSMDERAGGPAGSQSESVCRAHACGHTSVRSPTPIV